MWRDDADAENSVRVLNSSYCFLVRNKGLYSLDVPGIIYAHIPPISLLTLNLKLNPYDIPIFPTDPKPHVYTYIYIYTYITIFPLLPPSQFRGWLSLLTNLMTQ